MPVLETDSDAQNSIGYSNSNYDISDIKQLESLLDWDVGRVEGVVASEERPESVRKKRKLNEESPGGILSESAVPAAMCAGNSENTFQLARCLIVSVNKELTKDERIKGPFRDYYGLLSYLREAIMKVLYAVEDLDLIDFTYDPIASPSLSSRLCSILTSAELLLCAMAVIVGESSEYSIPSPQHNADQFECLRSVLFYVYAVTVQVSIQICQQNAAAGSGELSQAYDPVLETLLRSCARIMSVCSQKRVLCPFSSLSVPKERVIELIFCVCKAYYDMKKGSMYIDLATSMQTSKFSANDILCAEMGSFQLICRLIFLPNLFPAELLKSTLWNENSLKDTGLGQGCVSLRSPFPILEAMWDEMTLTELAVIISHCAEYLIERCTPVVMSELTGQIQTCLTESSFISPLTAKLDGIMAACVWLCRSVSSVLSQEVCSPQSCSRQVKILAHIPGVIGNIIPYLLEPVYWDTNNCYIDVMMNVLCLSFPKSVVEAISTCATFCSLLRDHPNIIGSSDPAIFAYFQLLDLTCTSVLSNGDSAVEVSELRRRALISDMLSAVGSLWVSSEPLVKISVSQVVSDLKNKDSQKGEPGPSLFSICVNHLASIRTAIGIIHCFHRNRGVSLQSSSRKVLDSVDVLIKECVVAAVPFHSSCCVISKALSVSLIDHGMGLCKEELRHLGHTGTEDRDLNRNDFLSVFGRMTLNASIKAVKFVDQEDYPDGEDTRHSLLRILVPALVQVVIRSSIVSPVVSLYVVLLMLMLLLTDIVLIDFFLGSS